MARAVEMGAKVKDSPHQAILKLAHRLTGSDLEHAGDRTGPMLRRSQRRRLNAQETASAAGDFNRKSKPMRQREQNNYAMN